MPVENPRLKAAILIANEAWGDHTIEDAKRLHSGKWEEYVFLSEPRTLNYSQFSQDPFRTRLLIETVEILLLSIQRKRAFAIGEYFGFWNGQQKTFAQVGEKMGIHGNSVLGLVRRGVRDFRHPSRNHHLRAFFKEDPESEDLSTEDLAEKLLTLPPIYPYRGPKEPLIFY